MLTNARFLILRLSSIGDVLHATPVAQVLKTTYPHCHITWLVDEVPSAMLKENPYIDDIYIWPRDRWEKHLGRGEWRAARQLWSTLRNYLHAQKFDILLDIHGLFISGLIAKASNIPRRIGMSDTRELNWLFMTEIAPSAPEDIHVIPRYLSILRPLGIHSSHYSMTLRVPDESLTFADEFLNQHGVKPSETLIAINPSTTWPAKNWPAEHYATVAKSLYQKGYRILLCGGPADQALGESIMHQSGVPLINAANKTSLLQLGALLSRCDLLVTGDTGPLHMAIALGIPTVSIFGPTDPKRFGPLTAGHIVLEREMDCRPCHKRTCPLKHLHCMYQLEPMEVIAAVQTVLDK